MDFLDPRRKRAQRRRLVIGYALMSILIAIGTTTVLYLVRGWNVDRETGEVYQNGTVFVDSKPRGASVYLDNVLQSSQTDMRMDIPAGVYNIKLALQGYRDWQRTFNLEGGQIQRLTYPFLIPNILNTSDMTQYDAAPQLATQSPDRRWLLVQRPGQIYEFDLFDLNDTAKAPIRLAFPIGVLTSPNAEAALKVVEWSNDNRHALFERSFEGKTEYIMFDRENTAHININKDLGITPKEISLKNKKADQIFWLDAVPGVLRSADLKNRTISAPLVNAVIDYKSYEDNLILYATNEGAETGKTDFKVIENEKTYLLKSLSISEAYVMDIAQYDNEWYYVVGASTDNMAFVYENPMAALKQETKTPLIVTAILRLDNPRFVSFSANTQFIGLQSGNQILTLDLELDRQYRTNLQHDIPISQKLDWMDGHRFKFTVNNQSYVVDFDGSNENTLVTSELTPGPFFDRDYDNVFTVESSKADRNKKALTITVIDPR